MPALAQERLYTIDDIYALPDGERAELIDGQIFYMAPPSTRHQRILSFLHLEIGNYIRSKGGTCEVFPAPFAVFLYEDDSKYLEPDISVVCDKNRLDEHGCKGAPDWIIEIVSPSSRAMDYYTKLSLYREAGVSEYWIVDPLKQIILVYNMQQAAAPAIYSFSDTVTAGNELPQAAAVIFGTSRLLFVFCCHLFFICCHLTAEPVKKH